MRCACMCVHVCTYPWRACCWFILSAQLCVAVWGPLSMSLCALLGALACSCTFLWVCVLAAHRALSRGLQGVPVGWQVLLSPRISCPLEFLSLLPCLVLPSLQASCLCLSLYLRKLFFHWLCGCTLLSGWGPEGANQANLQPCPWSSELKVMGG